THPAVVIVAADDVVFPQVLPVLDFDDDRRPGPRILDAMPNAPRYRHGTSHPEAPDAPGDEDARGAGNHHPVLRALPVPLKTQTVTRQHHEAFDLVTNPFIEHLEAAPWPRFESAPLRFEGRGWGCRLWRLHHGPMWMRRTKSAATALATSSITAGGTPPSRSQTTTPPPRP